MNAYEIENIAHQKAHSLRDEGAIERLVGGNQVKRSHMLPRVVGYAVVILTLIGWAAQYL